MRIIPSLIVLLIVLILSGLPSYGQEDLKVSISTSHVNANPGDEITYVIKYSNGGITPASNLIIKDYLSSSGLYTYVSSSPSGTVSGNVITWDQTQIQELALLSNGEFQISVTVKAGIPGNGVTQASNGYYISASPGILENHATITSSHTTIPVQSNVVSTQIEQKCGVHVNNASGVIKSSTKTMVYYLIQVTNNGNIYDRYDLSSINFDCDGPGGLGFDAIQASFADQSGNPITKTDWIAPDQTYYFLLKLKTDGGTNPGHWSCHRVIATSNIGGITGEGIIHTKVEGSPRYPLISLSKIDAKDPVEAGEIFTYKIYVFNSNDAYPASNLVVKETYPPNITFISSSPAPDPGFNNQWSLGTLDYGLSAAKTINITVKVNGLNNCNGTMTNTVSASYVGYDSANPPSASVVTTIKSYPDLVITKTARTPSTPAQKGEAITYTINYQNAGSCDAPNSQIKELFDDEHTNIISAGGGIQSGKTITWNLGLLTPGQSGTITYTTLIDPESTFNPGTTQIDSKATISTTATETNNNNNTATASVSVAVLPDMKVEILPDHQTADAGMEYSYKVKVSNAGNIAAVNVEIKNLLPAGLTIGSISHEGVNIGGVISWPIIPTFNADDYVEYQVKVTPSCSFIPSFTAVAIVTSAIIDKDETNNSVTINPVVQDMVSPVLANIPPDITVGCDNIPAIGSPTATDNCDNTPDVYYLGEASTRGTNPLLPDYYNYKLSRSWEAIDGSGNHSLKGIQVITIEDNTPPEIPVLADVTVGECSGTPVAPTTTDACKGVITGSTTTVFPLTTQGTTVVTWTFDDGNGNKTTANQNVIVKDTKAPVPDIAELPEITGECSAMVTAPTATDNCKDKIIGTTTDPLTYSEQGNYTIHWTYDDGQGNTSTQTQSVIVKDTKAPVPDIAELPVITGECSAMVTAPTATDNCKDKIVGTTTDPLTYSEPGNYTIHWTYDDGQGNTFTQTQSVLVDDTTPPQTPVLADVTVGECFGTPVAPTTADACKGVITGSTTTVFPITTQGTTVVTWTFDDSNGNKTTASQKVIVKDTKAPVPDIAELPEITGECSATATAPTATDNCKDKIVGTTTDPLTYSEPGNYTIRWTYDDGHGNTFTQTQSVLVDDTTPPEIPVLADVTVGECFGTPVAPTTMDACKGVITGSTTTVFPITTQGATVVTWTFDDGNGNAITANQNVIVKDTKAPIPDIAELPVITGECSATANTPTATDNCKDKIVGTTTDPLTYSEQGNYTIHWNYDDGQGNISTQTQGVVVDDTKAPVPDIAELPAITGECSATATAPTATDNCKDKIVGTTTDPLTYSEQGNYTIHWNYDDGNGNTSTQTQSVVVHDTTPPEIPVLADVTVGECSGTPVAPTTTDACKGVITGSTTTVFPITTQGATIVTWTFDDGNGNAITVNQNVIVKDTKAPIPDIAELPVITGECSATATAPTATDNCKDKIIGTTTDPLMYSEQGNYTIHWTYDDGYGNISTQAQSVVVDDTTSPEIPVLADVTVGECSGTPVAPTTTDLCKGTITGSTTTEFPLTTQGTTVVTWTFDDGNGNVTTANQNVIVANISAPVPDIAILPNATGECSVTVNAPLATKNCQGKIVGTTTDPLTYSEQGNYTIHWTYDDGQGNISTQTQSVVVDDTKAPVPDIAELPAITGECSATATAPTATDNCKDKIIGTTTDPLMYSEQGNYTIHWTYDDGQGNISTQTQSVVVDDTKAPVPDIAELPAITGECSATATAPTATDNCKDKIIGTTTDPLMYSEQGNYTIHWNYDDGYGNISTQAQSVVVDDITPPEIPVLADVTVGECSGTPVAPTTTDLCKGTITGSTTTEFPLTTQGTTVVTWTFDDGNGNAITANQNVIVKDTKAPVPDIAELPVITGECSATATAPTATDNCKDKIIGTTTDPLTYSEQGNYTIHWNYDDGQGNISTQTQSVVVDDTTSPEIPVLADVTVGECSGTPVAPTTTDACKGTITGSTTTVFPITSQGTTVVTWTFDDGNGNAITANQNVIVKDVTAPVPDLAILPILTGQSSITVTAPTATDNCSGSITGTTTDPLTYNVQGNYTIFWTYDDGHGNISTQTQSVVVDDTTPPETPVLADVTVGECSGTPVAPTTTDNSYGVITGTTLTAFPITVQGVTIVTWIFDDGKGNITTANQNVIVKDTKAPVPDLASLPAITAECSIAVTAPTATDNCKGKIVGTTTDPLTYSEQGNYTIHWTYDDGNGNISTQSQSVVVDDNTPPETPVLADVFLGECSGTPPTPTTMDNCAGIVKGTTSILFPKTKQGRHTIIWTFDDGHGNVTTAYQNLILEDKTAPVPDLASLPAITAECSIAVTAPSATDNCKGKIIGTTTDPLTYSEQGNYTIHWTYDDGNGNISTQTQSVVVDDTTPPETPLLADVFLGECSGTPPTPTTMDNCAGIVKGTTSILFPKTKQGKNTIIWTFDDGHGNVTTAYQNLILEDKTAPVPDLASLPAITAECSIAVTAPTATDNCKGKIIGTTTDPLTYSEQGNYAIHWTYDDGNGNISTQRQSVVVDDATPPETPVLADITLGECSGTPAVPTTTDVCKGVIIGRTTTAFPITNQGTTVVTWTFDDGNGNITTAKQNVIVLDNTPPQITGTIAPTTVEGCSAEEVTPAVNTVAALEAMGLSISDVCVEDHLLTVTSKDVLSNEMPVTVTRTYTIKDLRNNSTDYKQTIVVLDTQKPTIVCPPDLNLKADAVNCNVAGLVLSSPITEDNCSISTVKNDAPSVFGLGKTVVTWTVVDKSGNTATCQQNVTVDGIPVAKDDKITVDENSTIAGNVTANDQGLCDAPILMNIIAEPEFGNLTFSNDGSFEYTPDNNYFGKDKFNYQICDHDGDCSSATVEITINSKNDQPLANADTENLQVDVTWHGNVAVNDVLSGDGNNVWTLKTPTSNGTILFNKDGTYTYTPPTSFIGNDSFSYELCDANGDCSSATVTIHVEDVLLPNQILTPNSDDHNDTFIITGIEYYPINKVTIYNRWGNIVYSKNNYQNEWDGVSNLSKVGSKPLPVGTYYYLIDYGNNRHKTGFVYLDR